MSDTTTQTTNTPPTAGVPPTPPEAHQRADEGQGTEGAGFTATYSIHENKLRFKSDRYIEPGLFTRLAGAGFRWAPKEQVLFKPSWSPEAEDLLLQVCGVIEDEDMTPQERAEERAERFATYQQKRVSEACVAQEAVAAIAGRIEPGQPILVGHHSERRARKDKERIDNGMRKAAQLWDTAAYWQRRAAASLRHAEFKERVDVRARRIQTLEADQRKFQRQVDAAVETMNHWLLVPRFAWDEQSRIAARVAGGSTVSVSVPHADGYGVSLYHLLTAQGPRMHGDTAWRIAVDQLATTIERNQRWVRHFTNRIAFERHLLDAAGGLASKKFDIQPGGRVLIRGAWLTVKRVNRKAEAVVSVTVDAPYVPKRGIEEVEGYEPPTVQAAADAQAASKKPPICNYPGDDFLSMTNAEWTAKHKDYKGTRELGQGASLPGGYRPDIRRAGDPAPVGRHRVRVVVAHGAGLRPVFISDLKRKDPPSVAAGLAPAPQPQAPGPDASAVASMAAQRQQASAQLDAVSQGFDAMREQLRAGGAVAVAAPQLFSTADVYARRLVDAAEVPLGASVLEPQAGLGALLRAMPGLLPFGHQRQTWAGRVVAVEINPKLADALRDAGIAHQVHCANFLECTLEELGLFDRILMNPPYGFWADIRHIEHARTFLAAGGRLVAICADGPRQREVLKAAALASGGSYEALPAGAFAHVGTNVSTALVVINA